MITLEQALSARKSKNLYAQRVQEITSSYNKYIAGLEDDLLNAEIMLEKMLATPIADYTPNTRNWYCGSNGNDFEAIISMNKQITAIQDKINTARSYFMLLF